MKTKKIDKNTYHGYIHNTKKYTTIHLNFFFELEYTKENIFKCDLLEEYMLRTSKKYKKHSDIVRKFRENYSMKLTLSNYNIGQKMFVELQCVYPDPKLVQDNYIEEALKLSHEIFFNPNFVEGKLDRETLDKCKDGIISHYASMVEEPQYRAKTRFYEEAFPNTYLTLDFIHSKEEIKNLLDSFTDSDLIDMYKKIVDSFVTFTAVGNFDECFLENVKKYFPFKKSIELDNKYDIILHMNNKEETVRTLNKDKAESILYVGYDCKNYAKKKKYVYNAIRYILGCPGGILHKVLRDELKLIYSASAHFNPRSGYIVITTEIDRKNFEKTISGINKSLDMLKDFNTVREGLKLYKKEIELNDYIFDENKWNIVDEVVNSAIKVADSRKVRMNRIRTLKEEDIISEVDNLERNLVYFYEGAKNEEGLHRKDAQ